MAEAGETADEGQERALRREAAAAPRAMQRQQVLSFRVIAGTFILLLLIALAASWAAIAIVDTTRAYATGEGRYSKAQKMAVLDLHRFAYSQRESDYSAFLRDLRVPRGDYLARTALEQQPPDLAAARAGILQGDNHPDDVAGVIRMFLWFGWWEPFAAAVRDWRDGDALVERLMAAGARLAEHVTQGRLDDDTRTAALAEIDRLDERLTALENTFSTHMGEAARGATQLVILSLGATTILLWVIGIAFASRLFRGQLALDRQLGSSEQRFRDYAEVASDWYWEMDQAFRLTYVSPRFYAATGASPEATAGRQMLPFLRDHQTEADNCRELAAMAERRPFRGLILRFEQGGEASFWSLAGKPCWDEKGGFAGYRGVGSDITATVCDAQMLREAKERAEAANATKSEFLANMSHELRTPLNAILGFSEVIAKRHFGVHAVDRYAGYAGDIHRSARHLLAIIDDILDVAKIEAGRTELQESAIALDELVSGARTLLGDRFTEALLELRLELPAPPPLVRCDTRKLSQVLVNLLSNAIKFTPGGGHVTLTGQIVPDGGLAIAVCDSGIGIAAEHIATVLTPFGQVESAFHRKHQGTGLGLPLAKALIEQHGGRLTLESEPGAGTCVTLHLPAERVLRPPVSNPTQA